MTSLRSLSRAAVLMLVAFLPFSQPAFAGTSIETVNQLIAEGRLTDAQTVLRAILVTGTGEEKAQARQMLEQLDGRASDFTEGSQRSHKINFIVITEAPRESARWEDILTERPATKEGDAPIPTLRIHPSNMVSPPNGHNNPEIHKRHFSRVTNLTHLDQLSVQDEIAKILSEIPCRPGTTANLVLYATEQKDMQGILKIPTPWVPWKFNFSRCLVGDNGEHISLPNGACLYPHHDSSQMSDVNYDELIRELKKCRDAIQKKVREDNLLEKWKAATQSNSSTSGSNNP